MAILAVAAGLLANCDGAGGLTKEEFIEAANAICGRANQEFDELFETGFPTSPESVQEFVENVVPIVEREVDELQALDPPDNDADQIEEILGTGQRGVDDLRNASESPEASAEIFGEEGGENVAQFQERMVAYGAERCEFGEEAEEEEVIGPDPATFSPEKRAYIAEADAICQVANDAISPAEEAIFGEEAAALPTLEEWATFLEVVISANEEAQELLDALEPPAEDAEQVEAIFDRFRGLLEDARAARDAAAAGDQEAFDAAIGEVFPQFEEIDRQAREYGFQVCGVEEEEGNGEEEGGEPEE